jgi:uncharacterized protein YciI
LDDKGGAAHREAWMQWLIIARDGKDDEAERRRLAARPAHLENAARLQAKGHLLVGGALIDHDGRMIGSACVAHSRPARRWTNGCAPIHMSREACGKTSR